MNIVEELKEKLENANAKTIEELQQNEDPIYWFLLLAKYQEFAPNEAFFFNLRNHCDLPWSTLLASQEKFVKYCHFASLSRLELLLLALKTPKYMKKSFQILLLGICIAF